MTAERTTRRTDALTRQLIVATAIAILDAEGEDALTFRTLANRLATGAGAIYWHIANKDELLSSAAGTIIAEAVGSVLAHPDSATDQTKEISPAIDPAITPVTPVTNAGTHDPRAQVRAIALALYDAFDAHPWVGSQLAREPWREGSVQILEAIGSQLQPLGVPAASQFDAASALTTYISGAASQNAAHARSVPTNLDRAAYLAQAAQRWTRLDPADYPFVHRVLAGLADHDDRQQFLAGIDFILTGITA